MNAITKQYYADKEGPFFTEREVNIYLRGLKDGRTLAIETGKGLTASHAITEFMQTQNLRKEIVKHKGVWA